MAVSVLPVIENLNDRRTLLIRAGAGQRIGTYRITRMEMSRGAR
jgi:hypothetical protein